MQKGAKKVKITADMSPEMVGLAGDSSMLHSVNNTKYKGSVRVSKDSQTGYMRGS